MPCAGGARNNGPDGTDSIVDVSSLTPDQQFEAGLYCGSVHATPTTPISSTGLCPASQYGSTLVSIPAPGAENDDHNPPRIGSRNLFDIAIGHDNIFHSDRYKWSARIEVINLTNNESLSPPSCRLDLQRHALRNAADDLPSCIGSVFVDMDLEGIRGRGAREKECEKETGEAACAWHQFTSSRFQRAGAPPQAACRLFRKIPR